MVNIHISQQDMAEVDHGIVPSVHALEGQHNQELTFITSLRTFMLDFSQTDMAYVTIMWIM
jgi:hypothetical protein